MLSTRSGAAILPQGPVRAVRIGCVDGTPDLRAFLPEVEPVAAADPSADGLVALAASPGAARARALGGERQLPVSLLAPGLLRAPAIGRRPAPLLGLLATELAGPVARAPLRTPELLIADAACDEPSLLARAEAAMAQIRTARAGGRWWDPDPGPAALGLSPGMLIVVPDSAAGAADLLRAALAGRAAADIALVRTGALDDHAWAALALDARAKGCRLVETPVSPWSLLDAADAVMTGADEIGLLALIAGRRVLCHAPSAYAGWGATEDAAGVPARGVRRSVAQIVAGHCLLATRHADPFTGRPATLEDTLTLIGDWRRTNAANRSISACVGMSFWKRARVAEFLSSSEGTPRCTRSARTAVGLAAARRGTVAVWASRQPPDLAHEAAAAGIPVQLVEDGFLRSVGLGADFMPAASLVVDATGIYYDPTRPSDLETILSTERFDPALVERARRLIHLLVARGITKYNVGGGQAPDLGAPAGKRRILVPGQVEDDRSVLLGGAGVTGNLDLLSRVRAANPDAFVIYKPHPDVDAGHRRGVVPDAVAAQQADRIVRDVSSAALLAVVDEVHTLTSLVGFEGLLRSRKVVVYGQPFYAGWGLTQDQAPHPRRHRILSLEELVAGALILYPRYLDPVTRLPCGPEVIIDRLADPTLWKAGPLVTARRLQGNLVKRLTRLTARRAAS